MDTISPEVLAAIILVLGGILTWVLQELWRQRVKNDRLAAELASRPDPDKVMFQNLRFAFDRRAFQAPYDIERRLSHWTQDPEIGQDPFDEAIEATLKAVSQGLIVRRLGRQAGIDTIKTEGIAGIKDPARREKMQCVQARLTTITYALADLRRAERASQDASAPAPSPVDAQRFYAIIDQERDAIITTMNEIWTELDIPTLRIPTEVNVNYTWEE